MPDKKKYIIVNNAFNRKQYALFMKGHEVFFEQFYEQYKAYIFSIAIRHTRCKDDANDVFQDSFMRIFKYRKTFQKEQSVKNWISKITLNAALDYIKLNYKIELVEDPYEKAGDYAIEEDFHFDETLLAINASFQSELIKALSQLPSGARAVFNLYVIDNLSHDEIAEHLGITSSTSRSQLVKARKKLKDLLIHLKKKHEFARVG